MKLKRFNVFESEKSKSKFVTDAQVDDILDRTHGEDKKITDVQKNRMKMWSEGDQDSINITNDIASKIEKMEDTTKQISDFISNNPGQKPPQNLLNKIEVISHAISGDAKKLNDVYGVDTNTDKYKYFSKNERPDVFSKYD